jgi:hypothetical protein
MLLHRARDALMDALQPPRVRRAPDRVDKQGVREREAAAVVARGVQHGRADRLVDRLEQVVLRPRACGYREVDVEDPPNDGRRRQNAARLRREPVQPACHEIAHRHRQPQL